MKISSLVALVNRAFQFVILNSEKYHIDESHSLRHSMEVYHYASQIYNSEVANNPYLKEQLPVIYSSAILHDMCDKKYMVESEGLVGIQNYVKDYMSTEEVQAMSSIITTMSYSKVNANGFPDLDKYQLAYHIVRESDLLSGYDVSRCIIYQMMHEKYNFVDSINVAQSVFDKRMFTYIPDKLFVTDFSKQMADTLEKQSRAEVQRLVELNGWT